MVQAAAHEKASKLTDALNDAYQMLRNAESRMAGRESALQESESQLEGSRGEVRELRSRLGTATTSLQAAEARVDELQVGSPDTFSGLYLQVYSELHTKHQPSAQRYTIGLVCGP